VKIVASFSIKGGVGKTTAAINLAYEAAATGARTLLWDLDPQGAATYLMRLAPLIKGGADRLAGSHGALERHIHGTEQTGLEMVPSDFSLRNLDLFLDDIKRPRRRLRSLLDPLADRYDVAILDCPPGITLASESVLRAADFLVVPTIRGRLDGASIFNQASLWGSVLPAVWSFMLALRTRGLGSAWTTLHLHREQEMAELLGIPFDRVTQTGLFPVAYTVGTDFNPADRSASGAAIRWNHW